MAQAQAKTSTGRWKDPTYLRESLERIARHSPRYLFRGHSPKSGGDLRLNTVDAITTHAALDGTAPESIHDVDPQDLISNINAHLGWSQVRSRFSSWSPSLQFAMSVVSARSDAVISIVDTKMLPSSVLMLHTVALSQLFEGKSYSYPQEALCYGTVTGKAHRAVRYADLVKHGIHQLSIKPSVQKALTLGELFGPTFTIPSAVYVASTTPHLKSELVRTLSPDHLPKDWIDDASIMQQGYAHHGNMPEAISAINILRELAKKSDEVEDPQVRKKRKVEDVEIDAQEQREQDQKSQDATKASVDRLPRELRRLYIDMIGWN
jgi:hypothetical protein